MAYFDPLHEYLRPWKLVSLALGLLFLFAGALYTGLPDWDFGVSLVMAIPAYLTAAPTLRTIREHRWGDFLFHGLFWTWFTIDGTYLFYWAIVNPDALALRHANAAASAALYLMCGVVWYRQAPLLRPRTPTSCVAGRYWY